MSRRLTWRDACHNLPNAADSLPWRQPTEPAHKGSTFEERVAISVRKANAAPSESDWLWCDLITSVVLVSFIAVLCFKALP